MFIKLFQQLCCEFLVLVQYLYYTSELQCAPITLHASIAVCVISLAKNASINTLYVALNANFSLHFSSIPVLFSSIVLLLPSTAARSASVRLRCSPINFQFMHKLANFKSTLLEHTADRVFSATPACIVTPTE